MSEFGRRNARERASSTHGKCVCSVRDQQARLTDGTVTDNDTCSTAKYERPIVSYVPHNEITFSLTFDRLHCAVRAEVLR